MHWASYFTMHVSCSTSKQVTFSEVLKWKLSQRVCKTEFPSYLTHTKSLCPNKLMQTYHRQLLSTWFSNRYFSVFNVTATMLLWYFSAWRTFQHSARNKGTQRSIMFDLALVFLSVSIVKMHQYLSLLCSVLTSTKSLIYIFFLLS